MDAPVSMGATRARRLDKEMMRQAAKAIGQGMCKTGGGLSKVLQRCRKWAGKHVKANSMDKAYMKRVWSYWQSTRKHFHPSKVSTISCAMDGTRLAQRDTFYVAMWSPDNQQAAWCPPQARVGNGLWVRLCLCLRVRFGFAICVGLGRAMFAGFCRKPRGVS